MDLIISKKINPDKMTRVVRKQYFKRRKQLFNCANLADVKYGRLHMLTNDYAGCYSIRLDNMSRLLLVPVVNKELVKKNNYEITPNNIFRVKVYFIPNHNYRNYI